MKVVKTRMLRLGVTRLNRFKNENIYKSEFKK